MTEGNLFNEVKTSVDTLGINGVVEVLKKARLDKFKNETYLTVTNIVIESVDIPLCELEKNNSRSDKRKVAIGFCAFFLNTEFGYDHSKISKSLPFNLSRDSIANYHEIISCAKIRNPKSDLDKLISKSYDDILQKITNYKNQTKK